MLQSDVVPTGSGGVRRGCEAGVGCVREHESTLLLVSYMNENEQPAAIGSTDNPHDEQGHRLPASVDSEYDSDNVSITILSSIS